MSHPRISNGHNGTMDPIVITQGNELLIVIHDQIPIHTARVQVFKHPVYGSFFKDVEKDLFKATIIK